jgi:hypothetical protein
VEIPSGQAGDLIDTPWLMSDQRKLQPGVSFSQLAYQRSNQGASRLKYQVAASESAASKA